jgi:hypothetical protein
MCDFSLQAVKSRAAVVNDKLVVTDFGTGTRGVASIEDPTTAVCLLPGTELAFDEEITSLGMYMGPGEKTNATVARFRQLNKDKLMTHHDALELPDGRTILLNSLVTGQKATVLQLPAAPKTEAEAEEQKRIAYAG